MPSKLTQPNIQFQRQERSLAEQFLARLQSIPAKPPWAGFCPDLPHDLVGTRGARTMLGLVAKPDLQSFGEVLTIDGGWSAIDSARLGASLPSLNADSSRDVVLLRNFFLVTSTTREPGGSENAQTIMLIAGNGSTVGSFQMYRLDPVSAQWTVVAFDGTGFAGATAPAATIDGDTSHDSAYNSMADWTSFVLGAPARSDGAGDVDQPVFLWTNNSDPVMIYPSESGNLEFQPLTDQFSLVATEGDFRCVSLATFNDRVYFLNTFEEGVRHRYRLRRTARGTADPDPAALGAGFIDLDQYNGNGVAVRPIGNVLAVYFEDGVSFVRDTGDQVAPNAVQTLDTTRGLLSTHGVVSISNNQHFGIFDDGWWILDSNGRWQEVGVGNIEGQQFEKWKRTFYRLLDFQRKHRIYCKYDPSHNWVRIIFPSADEAITTAWIYDVTHDRVFPDEYADTITVWGEAIVYSSSEQTWASATDTWSSIAVTWAQLQAPSDIVKLAHGNENGFAYFHNDDFTSRNGVAIPWVYESLLSDAGRPLSLKATERLTTEYVDALNTNTVNAGFFDEVGGSATRNVVFSEGVSGDVRRRKVWSRLSANHFGFRVSGSGPVRIREFQIDFFEDGVEANEP